MKAMALKSLSDWELSDLLLRLLAVAEKGSAASGNWAHTSFNRMGVGRGGSDRSGTIGGGLGALGLDKTSTPDERREASARLREEREQSGEYVVKSILGLKRQRQAQAARIDEEVDAQKEIVNRKMKEVDKAFVPFSEIDFDDPKHDEAEREYTALWEDYIEECNTLTAIREKRNAAMKVTNQEIRERFLYVDDPAQFTLDTGKLRKVDQVQAGADEFARMVGVPDLNGETCQVVRSKRSRASYLDSRIYMTTTDGRQTTIHELGHWLEDKVPGLRTRAQNFRDRRTQGEQTVALRTATGIRSYKPYEIALLDKFMRAYMGKVYPSGHTEIVSMGMEYMWSQPIDFAEKDPEYFAFIYDAVRGR